MSWTGYPLPDDPLARTYDAAYAAVPNWDIGRPQRAFVAAADAGLVGDRVIDVGCDTGELALYLARRGHDATSTYGLTVAELRARFSGPAWELLLVRPATMERRGGGSPALFACAVRQ